MNCHVVLVSATALAVLSSPALAQRPYGQRPEGRMEALFEGITLTADQRAKVDSIQKHFREQMPALSPGSSPDSATRERMRGLFRQHMDDIRAVLTADQQKTFDRNLAAMRERRRGGGP
jgi:Spy/CpxP family protein refolding chaperone